MIESSSVIGGVDGWDRGSGGRSGLPHSTRFRRERPCPRSPHPPPVSPQAAPDLHCDVSRRSTNIEFLCQRFSFSSALQGGWHFSMTRRIILKNLNLTSCPNRAPGPLRVSLEQRLTRDGNLVRLLQLHHGRKSHCLAVAGRRP